MFCEIIFSQSFLREKIIKKYKLYNKFDRELLSEIPLYCQEKKQFEVQINFSVQNGIANDSIQ